MRTRNAATDEQRFHCRYEVRSDGCWQWRTLNPAGYGTFQTGSKYDGTKWQTGAHRWAYAHFIGAIPDGMTVDHECRNPACVNPAHLRLMTMRDNILAGDGPAAINARKTHCIRGHAFDAENTYIAGNGSRKCKQCYRDSNARRQHSPARLASNARYRATEESKAQQRAYVDANRQKIYERQRAWRAARRAAKQAT